MKLSKTEIDFLDEFDSKMNVHGLMSLIEEPSENERTEYKSLALWLNNNKTRYFDIKDRLNGLKNKYNITRTDGKPLNPNDEFFVLRLNGGKCEHHHKQACRKAALAYADAIEHHLPKLAEDLRKRVG